MQTNGSGGTGPMATEFEQNARIVIVGAGLAGLAAAQRLFDAGFTNEGVMILEAQERAGGRVQTIDYGDYLLELGAQWLHGARENPLYNWLNQMNMLNDFEDASLGQAGKFYTQQGEQIDTKLVERVLKIVNNSKESLFKKGNHHQKQQDKNNNLRTASEVFRCELKREIMMDKQLQVHANLVWSLFEWFLRYETIENGCDSMDEVSIESYANYSDLGNGALLNFKHGYASLLNWFLEHFPANKWLKLECPVRNISLIDKQLKVTYEHKGREQVVVCEHVIITCSLGYLKKHHKSLFTPSLPLTKQNLIESLGFGTVNKILLQFESPFWACEAIKLIWTENERQFPAWTRDIIAFDVVRRQPNLLIGWIGGAGAKLMELESDQQVGQVCLALLKRFLPSNHKPPSKLIKCLCSRWNSNAFTCGSYSFQSIKSQQLSLDQLKEPIKSNSDQVVRILFAGEATAGNLYSTTHGAVLSGWREAERLAELLRS